MQKRKLGNSGLEVSALDSRPEHIKQVAEASLKRCRERDILVEVQNLLIVSCQNN
jgi:hypothetical protein